MARQPASTMSTATKYHAWEGPSAAADGERAGFTTAAAIMPVAKSSASRCWRFRRGPSLVICLRNVRQLLEEAHDLPQFPGGDLGDPETRHTGHVDAVLEDPKQFARREAGDDFFEVGRIRAQPFGEFRPFDAWCAVA